MAKRIKILFTISNFDTSGSGNSIYDMVNGIDRTKFDPEICCAHNKGEFFKKIESLGVKVHLFSTTTAYRPWINLPFRILRIARFFRKHQFDVIHSWHWSSDITEPIAAKLAGIPYLYSKKAMGWKSKKWLWRSKLSTHIISVNQEMLDVYFSDMRHKVSYIPLCVDTKIFRPLPKSYRSPESVVINKDDFVIVSVANLVPVKGIELLMEAVKLIDRDNVKVFMVGDYNNDYGLSLKAQYEKPNSVYFTGKKLDVKPYLALADVFVIPTKDEGRREGLPIAPMEAMASERLVIGTNITGVKEVLQQFPQCLFEASNVNSLKQSLIECISMSIPVRKQVATDMRSYVEKHLSIELFITEHENLYLNLARESHN